jgi:hypothetical protein
VAIVLGGIALTILLIWALAESSNDDTIPVYYYY